MTPQEPDNHASGVMPEHPGQVLQRARELAGRTPAEVARDLRLSERTIERIESGRFEEIPAAYLRGYIANYAALLELDSAPLLAAVAPVDWAPLRPVLPMPRRSKQWAKMINFATYALVSVAIVAPLVYFFVLGGARLFEAELVSSPSHTGPAAEGVAPASYRDRIAGALSLAPADVADADSAHLSASALPLTGMRPLAPSNPDSEQAAAQDPVSAPVDADPRVTLQLSLDGDSWIEIQDASGERLEFDLLRSGTVREYTGLPPFDLLLGRANMVSVRLDGRPIAFVGDDRPGVAQARIGLSGAETDTPSEDGAEPAQPN